MKKRKLNSTNPKYYPVKEEVWKAGLDLQLPTNLKEIQETINEINNASKF